MIRECFWLTLTTEEWDMRPTNGARKSSGGKIIKPVTRKQYSPEEKIRTVLNGEDSIAERTVVRTYAQGIYYKW